MPLTQRELDRFKSLANTMVDEYQSRQHHITAARRHDRAFRRAEARSGLRRSLLAAAQDAAAREVGCPIGKLPSRGGRFFSSNDSWLERHFRIRTVHRSSGRLVVTCTDEQGLQHASEGVTENSFADFEPWVWGTAVGGPKGIDISEIVVARQVDVEVLDRVAKVIFADETTLYRPSTPIDPDGGFVPNEEDLDWGDDEASGAA